MKCVTLVLSEREVITMEKNQKGTQETNTLYIYIIKGFARNHGEQQVLKSKSNDIGLSE